MMWLGALPALAVAAVVVLGPGLIATSPLRAGVLARVALSGLVGVCAWGVAGALFGSLGLPFQAWQVLVPTAAAWAVAWGVRRLLPSLRLTPSRANGWLLAGAWILGAVLVAIVAFALVPDPDRISQTYDNVFHLSAVSAILDGFSGSPFTLRSLIETEAMGIAYYPDGWHLLAAATVQLSGASVAVAFDAAWIAVSALIWLPGVAWLTQTIVPARLAAVAAIVALPLGAAFGAFPYALLAWGTIYPTFLAHALLPAAVAVTILAIRGMSAPTRARRVPVVLAGAVGIAVAIGALGVAHPRVLPTWVVIGTPFVIWLLARVFRRGIRRGGAARRRAIGWLVGASSAVALAGAAAFAYAVVGLGLLDEPLADRLNGPQAAAVQTIPEGVLQAFAQIAMTGAGEETAAPAVLVALAVLVGIVVALRVPRARWIVASFLLLVLLFALAAGSDGAFAKVATGVWYKDRFRLAAAIPVLAIPLASLGIAWLARVLARARPARRAPVGMALSVVVAVASAATLALSGTSAAIGAVFFQPHEHAVDAVVSTRQVEFFDTVVRNVVPADQRVLGDPWDGSALTQLFAGREPVFPHVNGQWDEHRFQLAWNLEWIAEDPAICAALDALRVRYILYDPHAFGGGDPAGNHFPAPHEAVEAGLFSEVASDGGTALLRIDQCGPLP
ncbi:DUF6541 family protein [Microbacterium sp. G2-8]|uniref:DUF6541 family protein n=1 Tax=Microbacterium sp. G2-8 TaxID=2842454 RepID=UPI001C8910B2|nr:DUF6541 family protein [Microbacterium sp. G2-8]